MNYSATPKGNPPADLGATTPSTTLDPRLPSVYKDSRITEGPNEQAEAPDANCSLFVLTLLAAIDGADLALLPASFRALEQDLSLTPEQLAQLAMCQGAAQAVFSPLWGNLADHGVSRKRLLVLACLSWGLCTFLLAFVDDFGFMVPLRVFNGASLGMLSPVVQSLVASFSPRSSVGFNYGRIATGTAAGVLLSSFCCTAVSNTMIYGQQGWRVAFVVIAAISWLMALVVQNCLVDKRAPWNPDGIGVFNELYRLANFLTIPTFTVIVAQGAFGTIPWSGMAFNIMYFQYSGMEDVHAGFVATMMFAGQALGVMLGGAIGDRLAQWSRNYGRPLCAQITVLLSIPMVLLIYTSMYEWIIMASMMFLLGLIGSWASVGCNRPVFLEIVPESSRSGVFAWVICLDGSCASLLGTSSVGYLAMRLFNYSPTTDSIKDMPPDIREQNQHALGKALLLVTCIPWSICFFLYCLLYFTYKRDVAAVKEEARRGNETTALTKAVEGRSE